MLTAKDALQWVTRRPTPPWQLGELRSALRANPAQAFSLRLAITGLEGQTCLICVSIRDASLIQSSATFEAFQSAFNASVPSRETLVSVISYLGAHGAALTYLSNDWKTAAISSTLGNLKNFGGIVITDSNWKPDPVDVTVAVAGVLAGGPLGMFIGLYGVAASLTDPDSTLDYLNSYVGDSVPQSSAGGDTSVGSGSDVLYIDSTTITAPAPGVDLNSLVEAPPLDAEDVPDTPGDSGGDSGGDDGGNGDGDGGDGGG